MGLIKEVCRINVPCLLIGTRELKKKMNVVPNIKSEILPVSMYLSAPFEGRSLCQREFVRQRRFLLLLLLSLRLAQGRNIGRVLP